MSRRTVQLLRLAALAALIGALFVAGTRPSVQGYFELDYLRQITSRAGLVGVVIFLGLWAVSYLMQVPAIVFIVAALLGWGSLVGSAIAFTGLIFTTSVSFWTFRFVGGSPLAELDGDWTRSMFEQLDDRPIRTVAILRLVFLVNPLVNLSLVLTDIRYRDYLAGSMIGIVVPLAIIALATDTIIHYVAAM